MLAIILIFNINCDFNMYEILSETIFPTCPQQNDTNVMSPNDKWVTFFIEQKDNSMSLKDQEILMENSSTKNNKKF